jgi:hypothetical protein
MRINVTREGQAVTSVWVEGVPLDFSDGDVAYSVGLLADRGDGVAKDALPYIRVRLSNRKDGVRVYLDDA